MERPPERAIVDEEPGLEPEIFTRHGPQNTPPEKLFAARLKHY
jgi:hypothetical protein